MNCVVTGYSVPNDKDNKLRKIIKKIALSDINKEIIILSYFSESNNAEFRQFLFDNLTDKNKLIYDVKSSEDLTNDKIASLNQNTVEGITRRYFLSKNKNAENTNSKKQGQALNGFTSAKARNIAKSETAIQIIKFYRGAIDSGKKIDLSDIKKVVYSNVMKQFANYYGKDLVTSIATDTGINHDIASVSDIEDSKRLLDLYDKISKYNDYSKTRKLTEEELADKKNASKELFIGLTNLINSLPSYYETYKNYLALVNQLNSRNIDNWLDEVKSTKKLISIYKIFQEENTKGIEKTEATKQDQSVDNDETDINNLDSYDSVDLTAKGWINKLLKSFDQLVSDDVKLYLSLIPKQIKNINGDYIDDTQNELGVITYMDPQYVISQISNVADFSSIDGFVNSLRKASEDRPDLYGLRKIVKDIDYNNGGDILLANRLKSELGNFVINKIQTEIGNTIDCKISNASSKNRSIILFTLINNVVSTFKEAYDENDIRSLNSILNSINKYGIPTKIEDTNIIINKISSIFTKYFPNITEHNLKTYFQSSYGNNIVAYKNFINNLIGIINNASKQKELYQDAINKYTKYKIQYNEAIENGLEIPEEENYFKNLDLSKNFSDKYLINIVRELSNVITGKVQLNSFNAEGNLASDLIANNKVTNLIRQIQYGTEEDANIGLKNLLNFVTKNDMLKGNTLLFGILDSAGNPIRDEKGAIIEEYTGLFIPNGDGSYKINEKAKDIIRLALFDGVSNKNTGANELYETMPSVDYFTTMMRYFSNKRITEDKKIEDNVRFYDEFDLIPNTAGFFFRTPSDKPNNLVLFTKKYNYNELIRNNKINHKSPIFLALRQILINEVKEYIRNLVIVSEEITSKTGIKSRAGVRNIGRLYRNYHFIDKGSESNIEQLLNEDKTKLSGNVFKFSKLFSLSSFDIDEYLHTKLSLYGDVNKGLVTIFPNKSNFLVNIEQDEKGIFIKTPINCDWISSGEFNANFYSIIDNAVDNWVLDFNEEINSKLDAYKENLDNDYEDNDIKEVLFNYVIAYNNFDGLFEGDSKFYKSQDDFFKRAKETQASGKQSAAFSLADEMSGNIEDLGIDIGDILGLNSLSLKSTNGFRAITVKNLIKDSANITSIQKELKEIISKITKNKDFADAQSKFIADKYRKIAVDNAQSYITFEEWIRRRYNDGTLNQYADIIRKIYVGDISSLNYADINSFIQVQKNFYYDIYFDTQSECYAPRQIKNAEFVLIPQLLPDNSPLKDLYNLMKENGIDQVNNDETDKAGRKISIELWNEDGTIREDFNEQLNARKPIQNYYYQYLYKQQDIPSHLKDEENRAGIQIMKKIIDNISPECESFAKEFLTAYADNIKESYEQFLTDMGWELNEYGELINSSDRSTNLKFDKFYEIALKEGARLGMDSNYKDYFTPNNNGQTIMPNFMNNISTKAESIAQSLFNSHITRQKLPGWHATQIAGVGFRKSNGEPLQYHPAKEDRTGNENYVEIAVPRMSFKIPKTIKNEDGTIREFTPEDLPQEAQYGIMYRIPTEGKQSVAIYKIVAFLDDVFDSTVAIADGWQGQTGSDQDGDSVYGISFELDKDEEGNLKIKDDTRREKNNNTILRNMINIMKNDTSREENYLSSNFAQIEEEIKSTPKRLISSYNPFTSIDKMNDAMSGARLKAMSVIRDTFNSVANKGHAIVSDKHTITVLYDAKKYDINVLKERYNVKNKKGEYIENNVELTEDKKYIQVKHKRWAWSNDNRNVDGHLVTAYSSQTTAHILDAMKAGIIKNENEYTFGVLKTLVDLGTNYNTAINFLKQPAISIINDFYYGSESVYNPESSFIIPNAIKTIASKLITNKEITKFTPMSEIITVINSDEKIKESIKNLYGIEIEDIFKYDFPILTDKLIERLSHENQNETFEDYLFDLITVLQFKKIKNTSDKIERIAKCTRPDRFGAKETIRDTIEIEEEINKLSKKNDITVDGEPLLSVLYGSNSFYPSLKAFYEYSTIPSIRINKQLFTLENDYFNDIYKVVCTLIGKKLNGETYNKYKQYLVADTYRQLAILNTPLMVNEFGFIIANEDLIDEYSKNGSPLEGEMRRIYGLETPDITNFKVNDWNNPTKEELIAFSRLTPAQKVIKIKQNFPNGAEIFDFLEARVIDSNSLKYKKYSINKISFTDSSMDLDEMIYQHDSAFFNHNPFIKLAAIDLIKYAFIVEGFRFKFNGISKLISNNTLLNFKFANSNKSVIDELRQAIDVISKDENIPLFIEKFIRANSEITKNIILKSKGKTIVKGSAYDRFLKCRDTNTGLIKILDNKQNAALLNEINPYGKTIPTYIRITRGTGKNSITTLYKIKVLETEKGQKTIYMYPLNLLESNETNELSVNNVNNKYRSTEFYEALINNISSNDLNSEYFKSKEYEEYITYMLKQYSIPKQEFNNLGKELKENTGLEELANGEGRLSEQASSIVNKIRNIIEGIITYNENNLDIKTPINNGMFSYGLIDIYNYLPINTNQNITLNDGSVVNVTIRKHSLLSTMAFKYLQKYTYFDKATAIAEHVGIQELSTLKDLYDKHNLTTRNNKIVPTIPIYRFVINKSSELEKELTKSAEFEETEEDEVLASMTEDFKDEIIDVIEKTQEGGFINAEHVAQIVVSDILKYGSSTFEKQINDFRHQLNIRGVNSYNVESMNKNKKYVIHNAMLYYQKVASQINETINNIKLSNGKIYSIDDKQLYEDLVKLGKEDYDKVVRAILNAKSFGRNITAPINLSFVDEDTEIQQWLDIIKKSIDEIQNNNKIHNAILNMYNIYFAKKFSTNPNIKSGIGLMTETFNDSDLTDYLFSDVHELGHKVVQVVSKYISDTIYNAEGIDSVKAVEDFKANIKRICGDDLSLFDKVIKNGKIVQDYKEELLEDKRKLEQDLDIIELKYGNDSKEYFNAKLALDEFMNDHFQQPVEKEYYDVDIALRKHVIKAAGDLFYKYYKLTRNLYDKDNQLANTEDEQQRINQIKLQIKQLLSSYDISGERKSDDEIEKIKVILSYKKQVRYNKAKYYETSPTEDFFDKLKYYRTIVDDYNAKHSDMRLDDKLKNEDYKEAYYWIKNNSLLMFSADANLEIENAFAELRRTDVLDAKKEGRNANPILKQILLREANHTDSNGTLDGRTFTPEQIKQIRDEKLKSFALDYESIDGDGDLIKNIPNSGIVYKSSFYDLFNSVPLSKEIKEEKAKIIKRINELIIHGVDETGRINAKTLFDYYTDENGNPKKELQELANLYKELKNIKSGKKSKSTVKDIKANVEFKTDSSFMEDYAYYKAKLHGTKFDKLFSYIFIDNVFDDNGNYDFPVDEEGRVKITGNSNIYGYIEAKDVEKYIDEAKTKARKVIEEDIEFIPTEYYYDKLRTEGIDSEWYKENHVYNPYTHKWEPLQIWTTMAPRVGGRFDNKESYTIAPTEDYKTRKIKDDKKNPEYKEDAIQYIAGDKKYDAIPLKGKEKELRDYLQGVMKDMNIGDKYKQRIKEGFAPSRYKEHIDAKYWGKQALGVLGASLDTRQKEFKDHLNFNEDFESDFSMLEDIKPKGYKDLPKKPDKKSYPNVNDYIADLDKWRKEVDEITKANKKLQEEYRSKDWYSIFQDFVQQSVIRNTKMQLKDTGYLLLEYLKNDPAYKLSYLGKVEKSDEKSIEGQYKTTPQTRTYDLVDNYLKRQLFNQFKDKNVITPYANMLQNLASAKYMIFNITGGVANVTTGFTNIMGEVYAKEYFNEKSLLRALNQYRKAIPNIISHMYKETDSCETAAILKKFNIVDFTEFTERRPDETVSEHTKRVRDALYSLQNGGEHMMQNVVLLAMLEDYRLWQDKTSGKWVVGNINDYRMGLEEVALVNAIKDNNNLYRSWIYFKQEINNDKNELKKYDQFRRNIITDFIKGRINKEDRDNIIKKYTENRKQLLDESTKRFEQFNTVGSQLTYEGNKEVIVAGSHLNECFGQFKDTVISVNKKIHGVYDKIGAAYIEKFWYGGIVMQYHKHLYPGILKRWRIKGLYNEHRGTREVGSYISVGRFLTTEFRGIDVKNKDNQEISVLESIQNIFKATIDTFANLKVNWELMDDWEKANCRRTIGDLCGLVSGILLACAIYSMTDDDDLKESNFLATCLYLSDRLYQESNLYTPQGLMTEGKTMWSSPIASEKLIEDMFASMTIITNWMIDPNYSIYYTNGIYNGENKLWVKLRRNIPIYRVYDRLSRMTVNNNYYRIGDNNRNLKLARWVADFVNPEE